MDVEKQKSESITMDEMEFTQDIQTEEYKGMEYEDIDSTEKSYQNVSKFLEKGNIGNKTKTSCKEACVGKHSEMGVASFLSIILHVPCIIFVYICGAILKRLHLKTRNAEDKSTENNIFSRLKGKKEFNNMNKFWGPYDIITSEDKILYKEKINSSLIICQGVNPEECYMTELMKELDHVASNLFINRFKACIELIGSNNLQGNKYIIHIVLEIIKRAIYRQKCAIIKPLLFENEAISSILGVDVLSYVMTDKQYTPTHMFIINKNKKILKYVLSIQGESAKYKMVNRRTKSETIKASFPASELPLNLAVYVGDKDMIKILIESGAEMCQQDSHGYNCFHVVTLLSENSPETAGDIFNFLLQQIEVWVSKTKICSSLRSVSPTVREITSLQILLKACTNNGLTPLKLSAALGCSELFTKILSTHTIYKQPHLYMGCKSTSFYDMSEIDPLLSQTCTHPTVLELLVFRYDDKALECLRHPVISQMNQIKGYMYTVYLTIAAIVHVTIMILYNATAYLFLFPYLLKNFTRPIENFTGKEENQTYDGAFTVHERRFALQWVDYFALTIAFLYTFYYCVCTLAIRQISKRCKLNCAKQFWAYNSLQIQSMLLFSISIVIYFVLKINQNTNEAFALSISMLLGWIHCMMYTRIFRSTGFFTIMIRRIIFTDVLRFLFIILIISLSFTMAAMVLYATEFCFEDNGNKFYNNIYYIMFDFFRLALGIADYTRLLETYHQILANVLYIFFVVFCNILLFNLLIAAMNRSYGVIGHNDELHWRRVRLSDMVILEWVVPYCLKRRSMAYYTKQILKIVLDEDKQFEYEQFLLEAPDCVNMQNFLVKCEGL